jgi:hypothetical protein
MIYDSFGGSEAYLGRPVQPAEIATSSGIGVLRVLDAPIWKKGLPTVIAGGEQ